MILGPGIKELPSSAFRGRHALQVLAKVPPASVELRRWDGAVEYTPAVLVNEITEGQEGNLRVYKQWFSL